jgi:hypothetical protein
MSDYGGEWGNSSDWATKDRAKILGLDPSAPAPVLLNYNPEKLTCTRTAKISSPPTPGQPYPVWKRSDPARISIAEAVIEGLDTKQRCDVLIGWTVPPFAFFGAGMFTSLPVLLFQWGPPVVAFTMPVQLQDCSVSYVRFTDMGVPVRAKVNLTFIEYRGKPEGTNPTSGGIPGRGARTVHQGDSLAQITKEAYGHPRHWRDVARANGIEDPLRIKPGQHVYLPNPSEFTKEVE